MTRTVQLALTGREIAMLLQSIADRLASIHPEGRRDVEGAQLEQLALARLSTKIHLRAALTWRKEMRINLLNEELEIFADALLNPEGTEGVEPKTWAAAAEIVEKWIQQRAALVDSDIKMPSSVA